MIRLLRSISVASAFAGLAMASMAQTTEAPAPKDTMPKVDDRQTTQDRRIEKGTESGELTHHEKRRLRVEQRAIDKAEKHAEADGKVTPRERHALDRAQDAASKDIKRQKHDKAGAQ